MAPRIEDAAPGLHNEAIPILTSGDTTNSPKLTRQQWLTMIAIGGVHFSSAICISIQAPFYPKEAELKGATASEYGLVFGIFELGAFIASSIFGKYVERIGVKSLLNIGMVVAAVSSILFGMLEFVMDHYWFIYLSFLLRIIEAFGSIAAVVAAFSIIAAAFPKSVGTTFATLEMFYGIGYIFGPSIGGVLFSIGGFKLPFFFNGIAMFLIDLMIFFILPPLPVEPFQKTKEGPLTFLKIPAVLLNSIAVGATAISMGFYSATLEPHLRIFKLGPIATGLMFVLSGGTYACVAPIVGRILDRGTHPKRIISVGCLLIILSFTIVGPAPFAPLPTTLPLCIFGLMLHGFGLAATFVPTFKDSLSTAVSAGYGDNINTYGILSGLWMASFSLGCFIGPSVAGVLFDEVGFRYETLFVIVIHSILFVVCNCFIVFEKKKNLQANNMRLSSRKLDTHEEGSSKAEAKSNLLSSEWENPTRRIVP